VVREIRGSIGIVTGGESQRWEGVGVVGEEGLKFSFMDKQSHFFLHCYNSTPKYKNN